MTNSSPWKPWPIEIDGLPIGLPIKHGDVRYKSPYFPMVFPWFTELKNGGSFHPSELSHWVMIWQQGTHDRMSGLWRRDVGHSKCAGWWLPLLSRSVHPFCK